MQWLIDVMNGETTFLGVLKLYISTVVISLKKYKMHHDSCRTETTIKMKVGLVYFFHSSVYWFVMLFIDFTCPYFICLCVHLLKWCGSSGENVHLAVLPDRNLSAHSPAWIIKSSAGWAVCFELVTAGTSITILLLHFIQELFSNLYM
jgi:hypothetical protein